MRITSIELAPIVSHTGDINRVAREVARVQTSLLRPKTYGPYVSYREEVITCREKTTGIYEASLGNEPVILEWASRKGQIVDVWL